VWTPKRVLALAPHTDDYEIGAGGFIHRLLRSGAAVRAIAFSIATESLPAGLPPDTLVHECRESGRRLGLPDDALTILDHPVRRFPEHRQAILEHMVAVRREFSPDLVLAHASTDVHQDHQVIHNEAVRAFKQTTILGYELPWNNVAFTSSCVVEIDEADLGAKLHALDAYASQRHRTYAKADVIRGLAAVRGATVGRPFGEAFEVVRWVLPAAS